MSLQVSENTYLPWHEAHFRQLLAERGRLPHAVLIHGREGIGKLKFARAAAQTLLCESPQSGLMCGLCAACGWFGAGSHPDFRLIEPAALAESEEAEQGTGKSSARILIEQIRDLADFINVSSHRGGAKVVLIHPAEALNPNAANALLKGLEEPPAATYFLLVAHRIHFLLPTLRSRCRHIALPVPTADAAAAWLGAQGVPDPALALAHTGNAPLLALALDGREFWRRRHDFLDHMAARPFDPLATAEQVCDCPMRDVLTWLQKWTFDLVFQKIAGRIRYNPDRVSAIAATAARIEPVPILRLHRELLKLQRVIDHPLNPRLLLEQLLLDYTAAVESSHRAS